MAGFSLTNPSEVVAIGVGIGVVDAFIFTHALPSMADIRTATPQNNDIDAARRQATGLAIAVNGLVSLMTRNWDVFLIGGVVTAGLSWFAVHANAVNPETGKAGTPGNAVVSADQDNANAYAMPDYGYADQ